MGNIKKIYDDAARTNQIYPQTHEKAVVDSNGTTLESKLGMIEDLINQAQLEIGAVPIDLTPTRGNTDHIVSSDGIATAIKMEYNTIDIPNAIHINKTINSSKDWQSQGICTLVPCEEYEYVFVKANSSLNNIVAFLTIDDMVSTAAPLVSGTDRIVVTANTSSKLEIPFGTKYLYVLLSTNGTYVNTPSELTLMRAEKTNSINEDDSRCVTGGTIYNETENLLWDVLNVDLSDYTTIKNTINTDNAWSNGGNHYLISVGNYTKVVVQASSTLAGAIVAFLSSTETNGTVSFVGGSRKVLKAGEKRIFDIPSGANYIYITNYTGSVYVTPQSVVLKKKKSSGSGVGTDVNLNIALFGTNNVKLYNVNDVLDLSDYDTVAGRIIVDTTKYWQTGELASARIPVINISEIEVQANSSLNARIAFTREVETSGNPSLCQSAGIVEVATSSTVKIPVPFDARFIIVDKQLQNNTASRIPTYIKVTKIGEVHLEYKPIERCLHYDEVMNRLEIARYRESRGTKGEGVLTFLVGTDIHGSVPTFKELVRVSDYFKNLIDFTVSLGDNVLSYYSDGFSFWNDCGLQNVWNMLGNHDTRTSGDWQGAGQQTCYERYIEPYIDNWGVTKQDSSIDPYACYYYKDFAVNGSASNSIETIRVMVLDPMFVDDNQLNWMEARLGEATTNGYSVVILCHYPITYTTTDTNADISTIDYIGFNSSTVPHYRESDVRTLVSNFIDGGGKFVCWISGHRHYDEIGTSVADSRIINITLEKSSSSRDSDNEDTCGNHEGARIHNELSQNSLTFVVIDPVSKYIKLIRLGNTLNCHLRSKKWLCYKYDTKTVIGQG